MKGSRLTEDFARSLPHSFSNVQWQSLPTLSAIGSPQKIVPKCVLRLAGGKWPPADWARNVGVNGRCSLGSHDLIKRAAFRASKIDLSSFDGDRRMAATAQR